MRKPRDRGEKGKGKHSKRPGMNSTFLTVSTLRKGWGVLEGSVGSKELRVFVGSMTSRFKSTTTVGKTTTSYLRLAHSLA